MPFPIEEFSNINVCMHCETEEEANIFLNFLHSVRRTWCDGDSYLSSNKFEVHGRNTCYYFNEGTYGDVRHVTGILGAQILRFSDWFTLNDDKFETDNSELDEFFSTITIHK